MLLTVLRVIAGTVQNRVRVLCPSYLIRLLRAVFSCTMGCPTSIRITDVMLSPGMTGS
uniref:Uncharacterized protein n=1 Tax=Anguilla anguilla TaxID=7936 RepID=A0A0E9UFC7_ANGAN